MKIPSRWRLAFLLLGMGACIAMLFVLNAGCTTQTVEPVSQPGPPWFVDVTDEVGLNFTHDIGPVATYFMPQILGSGVAVFDFDGDGKMDLYFVQSGGPKCPSKGKLYRQVAGGKFQDVSAGSGLDVTGYGMGVAVGDVNNDGRPDIYISEYGGGRLFLNKGNGKFELQDCGLAVMKWGTAVSFLDYDRDGWLDLVVVNFLDWDPARPCFSQDGKPDFCGPDVSKGTITRLYRNLGVDKSGKWLGYEDRTDKSGIGANPGPGLGLLCADFNGDGWPDIFVANDGKANHLWLNEKNGTFKESGVLKGVAFNAKGERQANMGVTWGDIDGSGFSSLFVTHLNNERHGLWKTRNNDVFQEVASSAGLAELRWDGTGFGTMFADFDQDGALDLAIANGGVYAGKSTGTFWSAYAEKNQVLKNDGAGVFKDISLDNPAVCGEPNVARGLAIGDFTGTGAMDMIITRIDGKARLFRNVAPDRGHWLMVRAIDPVRKRDAIGADIAVVAGVRRWQRLLQPSQSFLCSNDPRVHFGLGKVDRIDAVEVQWPDGQRERFDIAGAADRLVEVRQGEGKSLPAKEARR